MPNSSRLIALLFGAALALTGVFILFSGGIDLPTRHPPKRMHFRGLSLLLLGVSPLVAGGAVIGIAQGRWDRESRAVHGAIGCSIGALCVALLLANAP